MILFLDKLSDIKLGLIPLTLVLSLKSKCLRFELLQAYIIPLSGWISILLRLSVSRVLLYLINTINLSYRVNWFLSFSSGDERDIFFICELISTSKRLERTSLPRRQLCKINSLIEGSDFNFVGSIRFLERFKETKGDDSMILLRCEMQEGPR